MLARQETLTQFELTAARASTRPSTRHISHPHIFVAMNFNQGTWYVAYDKDASECLCISTGQSTQVSNGVDVFCALSLTVVPEGCSGLYILARDVIDGVVSSLEYS